jgi:CO/xanthine dehydrogenase Mo-binding subunit
MTSRRDFLKTAALSGASLVIGFNGVRLLHGAKTSVANRFKPNAWIGIDADGIVTLTIGKSEMGQGVRTSLAILLAEELEADWTHINLVQASPWPGSDLGTGGSRVRADRDDLAVPDDDRLIARDEAGHHVEDTGMGQRDRYGGAGQGECNREGDNVVSSGHDGLASIQSRNVRTIRHYQAAI